jgi:hypothetical protein
LGQGGENRHLTIVHLAQTAGPLAFDPNGLLALLLKGSLVDQEAGVFRTAKMAIRISRHLIQDIASLPCGIGNEVLEGLVATVGHDLLHAFHIFATRLHQALQVDMSLEGNGAGPSKEIPSEAIDEIMEPKPHLLDWGWDIGRLLGFTSF